MAKKLKNWPKSSLFWYNSSNSVIPAKPGAVKNDHFFTHRSWCGFLRGTGGVSVMYSKDTPVPVTSENWKKGTFLLVTGESFQKPAFFSIRGEPPSGTQDHYCHIWTLFPTFHRKVRSDTSQHVSYTPQPMKFIEIINELLKILKNSLNISTFIEDFYEFVYMMAPVGYPTRSGWKTLGGWTQRHQPLRHEPHNYVKPWWWQ